tara:strand:- start:282 stop:440 length:159 start_codon:yes stop_codon:yes gene_type:complete
MLAMMVAFEEAVPQPGGDYTAIAPLVINGHVVARPHTTLSDERYENRDLIVL